MPALDGGCEVLQIKLNAPSRWAADDDLHGPTRWVEDSLQRVGGAEALPVPGRQAGERH